MVGKFLGKTRYEYSYMVCMRGRYKLNYYLIVSYYESLNWNNEFVLVNF